MPHQRAPPTSMIDLQGDKRHHLDGVKLHHLQGAKLHHLQGVKLHHLQGAKLHHLQGAKLQLLSKQEWRPNIICIKRRQETRLFIDKHPEHRHHKEDTINRLRHLRHQDEEFMMSTNHNAQASSRRHHKHKKSAKADDHRRECHVDDQVRHLHQPSARHANDLRRHHHRAPSTTRATTTMAPRASLPPRHQASMPRLDVLDDACNLMDEKDEDLYFAKLDEYVKRTTQAKVQDGNDKVKNVEHGTFP